jgi:small subunit ribosomal protein S9
MATKKVKDIKEEPKKEETKNPLYFYAVGRRKTAIAQARIYPNEKAEKFLVNEREMEDYFSIIRFREAVRAPLKAVGQEGKYDVTIKVSGGGVNSQAEAIRLAISRALVKMDENLKKSLKDRGFLTRDPRIVERKKPGLKKARKAPQWAKR